MKCKPKQVKPVNIRHYWNGQLEREGGRETVLTDALMKL